MAVERPEIPLHTNGSENDHRCQGTKRRISGGTRSEAGRAGRDAFLGPIKTYRKLGLAFWDYLGGEARHPRCTRRAAPPRPRQSPVRVGVTARTSAPVANP
jgi:hypothetical protein